MYKKIKKKNIINNSSFLKRVKELVLKKNSFSNKIGIDLGTSSVVAYLNKTEILLNAPTILAINKNTNQTISIGKKARAMIGRTPEYIEVIKPVSEGFMNDYEMIKQIFKYLVSLAQQKNPKFLSAPEIVVGIPCNATSSQISVLKSAGEDIGVKSIDIVYEPLAALIGSGININLEKASMVLDIGAGTSDILLISGGEIIAIDSISIGGDLFDKAICEGLKNTKNIIVGLTTAEDLKIDIFSKSVEKDAKYVIKGRNKNTGLPIEETVKIEEIIFFINDHIKEIIKHTRKFIEGLSSEILSDLKDKGMFFTGGGTIINILKPGLEKELNIKVNIPEDPLMLVGRGTAIISENKEKYSKYFL